MKKCFVLFTVISLIAFLFLFNIPSVNSISTAEIDKMRYQFQGGTFYGAIDWLSDDIHPGDEVTYQIALSSFVSNTKISKLEVRITYPHIIQQNGKYYRVWETIYYDEVLTNYILPLIPEAWSINITVTLPSDADTNQRMEITVDIYYLPYEGAQEERFVYWARAPLVLYETYDEIKEERNELRLDFNELYSQYIFLNSSYNAYKATHSYSNSEYNALNSTYNQYVESHSYSNSEYDNLLSSYNALNKELSLSKNLIYIMIAITIVFIASTIYFARRKPKIS